VLKKKQLPMAILMDPPEPTEDVSSSSRCEGSDHTEVLLLGTGSPFQTDHEGVGVDARPLFERKKQRLSGTLHGVGCDGAHKRRAPRVRWELEGKTYPHRRILLADIESRGQPEKVDQLLIRSLLLEFPVSRRIAVTATALANESPTRIQTEEGNRPPWKAVIKSCQGVQLFGKEPHEQLWSKSAHIQCPKRVHTFVLGRV